MKKNRKLRVLKEGKKKWRLHKYTISLLKSGFGLIRWSRVIIANKKIDENFRENWNRVRRDIALSLIFV